MVKIFLLGLLFIPCMAFAATKCWLDEYPDHYVAVCIGDKSEVQTLSHTPETPKYRQPQTEETSGAANAAGQASASVFPETTATTTTATTLTAGTFIQGAQQPAAQPQVMNQGDANYGPRPGRISKSRMDAAINARNRLLQQVSQGEGQKSSNQ